MPTPTTRALTDSTSLPALARALALPQAIAFATTVPLDGRKAMAAQTINAATAFAAGASPVLGAECFVRLTGDGTTAPTFPGFTQHGSSAGYNNGSGIVNLVTFWFDGATAWYSIAQAAVAVPAATLASASVENAAPSSLVATFSLALASTTPAASAFAVTNTGGSTNVTAAAVSGSQVTLTLSRAVQASETVTVAYAKPGSNPLTDANGNQVASFTAQAVTNNVGGGNTSFVGTDLTMSSPAYSTGATGFGQALTGGYGSIPSTGGTPAATTYSIEFFATFGSAPSAIEVMSSQDTRFVLGWSSDGRLQANVLNSSGGDNFFNGGGYGGGGTNPNVTSGGRKHIRLSVKPGEQKLEVDASLVGTLAVATPSSANGSSPFGVRVHGNSALGSFVFSGAIDEIAIFDTYRAGLAVPTAPYSKNNAGVVQLWHLDGNGNKSAT